MTLRRSEIKNAPYNPRKITDEALTQLRKNFRRVGLLGGIVVNKRTMHIISGHQRLTALDQLEKNEDYLIRCEITDVDEATEIEQNIFMNSHSVQGEFDIDKLRSLVPTIDYSNAGLTDIDMSMIGIDLPRGADIDMVTSELSDMTEKKPEKTEEQKQANIDHIKDLKKSIRNDIDNKFDEGDPLLCLSFDSFKSKTEFMRRFGLDEYQKFIKGEMFSQMIERAD